MPLLLLLLLLLQVQVLMHEVLLHWLVMLLHCTLLLQAMWWLRVHLCTARCLTVVMAAVHLVVQTGISMKGKPLSNGTEAGPESNAEKKPRHQCFWLFHCTCTLCKGRPPDYPLYPTKVSNQAPCTRKLGQLWGTD